MKFPTSLLVILASLLAASSLPASAAAGYRLVPIAERGATGIAAFELNRRGEVVGMRTVAGKTRAFRWRAGKFTDLHDAIDSASSYTQAIAINDHCAMVAVDWTNEEYHG